MPHIPAPHTDQKTILYKKMSSVQIQMKIKCMNTYGQSISEPIFALKGACSIKFHNLDLQGG